jgi:hypothetical protein
MAMASVDLEKDWKWSPNRYGEDGKKSSKNKKAKKKQKKTTKNAKEDGDFGSQEMRLSGSGRGEKKRGLMSYREQKKPEKKRKKKKKKKKEAADSRSRNKASRRSKMKNGGAMTR